MKLGIFGDSYADVGRPARTSNDFLTDSWPGIMKSKNPMYQIDYFALSGTSYWYSYSKFLENYKKYDTIVFVHTNPSRWPNLPESEGVGTQWNIGYLKGSDTLNELNKYFFDIFPDNFRTFISNNIYRSVCELCEKQNIYLINIIAFNDEYQTIYQSKFPTIYGIDKLSWTERIRSNNIDHNLNEFISETKSGDKRYCHLNQHNNNKVADIILDLIYNKKINVEINLLNLDIWAIFDDKLDKLYRENL